jgi:hypothetical protein
MIYCEVWKGWIRRQILSKKPQIDWLSSRTCNQYTKHKYTIVLDSILQIINNERMNQWINESINQWINESMNQWINEWEYSFDVRYSFLFFLRWSSEEIWQCITIEKTTIFSNQLRTKMFVEMSYNITHSIE